LRGWRKRFDDEEADKLSDDGRDYLRRIISSSQRLDKMITDVLAYSRMNVDPIVRKRLNVEQLVLAVIEQNPNLQSPKAEIELQRPLLNAVGHETSFTQCVSNLLSNAVKFVTSGVTPRVRIWTEAVDGAFEFVSRTMALESPRNTKSGFSKPLSA
jgi:signal transduction histidine kinase